MGGISDVLLVEWGGYIRRVVGRMGCVISDVLLVEWGGYIRRVVGRMGGLYQTCCR